ncbi:Pre-mRNA-splicing factor [Dictyocoela muelleri]|nr:Pre-mRNA-splicing factor [Dictyocoela muelleri]
MYPIPLNLKGNRKTRKQNQKLKKYEQLKLIVQNPELFYLEDLSSKNILFENSKKLRDSVYVPIYWKKGRKYLNEKNYKKVPYVVPQNIMDTGILATQNNKMYSDDIKVKSREKIFPKVGLKNINPTLKFKIDNKTDNSYEENSYEENSYEENSYTDCLINENIENPLETNFEKLLKDCFFKYQQTPIYRKFGDLYSPIAEKKKEFDKKPGVLSDELKFALGIGANSEVPWIMNMKKYGFPNIEFEEKEKVSIEHPSLFFKKLQDFFSK